MGFLRCLNPVRSKGDPRITELTTKMLYDQRSVEQHNAECGEDGTNNMDIMDEVDAVKPFAVVR
jgi:hypothetical protein